MSETFEDRFKEALRQYLIRQGIEATEVTGYSQDKTEGHRWSEYTYEGDITTVDIDYMADHLVFTSTYTYTGDFANLVRELT